MQRVVSFALAFSFLTALGCQGGMGGGGGTVEPKTEEQKTLYAVGVWVSQKIMAFNLKPDEIPYVVQGIRDGVSGKKPPIEMSVYGPKMNELAQSRTKARVADEKKAAEGFLDAASKEAGAEKLPSGLIFKSIKEGTGENPKATDKVTVHYHGTLRDGKVFDSSVDRKQPASFALNAVIPCWTEGVQKIKVGGKAKLTCPSNIAYGDTGRPGIPPGAVLTFEVELISIDAPSATPPGMPALPPGIHPGMNIGGPQPGGMGARPGAPGMTAPHPSVPGGAPATPPATTK